ncbi:MAG: hypothetical protein AAF399_17615, partial [Bacteroidota bacterium]
PLALSAHQLVTRLQELFTYKVQYFRAKNRRSERDLYHYVSTVYRLCRILGWIRAAQREQSTLGVSDRTFSQKIIKAIREVQSALADGRVTPGSRLKSLAKRWELELPEMEQDQVKQLEDSIDDLLWQSLGNRPRKDLLSFSKDEQVDILRKVAALLCEAIDEKLVLDDVLTSHRSTAYRALARTEAWIYRDWQQAIGDVMLRESNMESSTRKLTVIGYLEFEQLYLEHQSNENEHLWLERIEQLFYNLNLHLGNADEIDARVGQLRTLSKTLVDLVQVLEEADSGSDLFTEDEREEMKTFMEAIATEGETNP